MERGKKWGRGMKLPPLESGKDGSLNRKKSRGTRVNSEIKREGGTKKSSFNWEDKT